MEDHHYLRTSSRSCWSFLNKTDIQHSFTDLTGDAISQGLQQNLQMVSWIFWWTWWSRLTPSRHVLRLQLSGINISRSNTHHSGPELDPTIHLFSMFLNWNSSLLQENVKKRRNDETRQSNGFDRLSPEVVTWTPLNKVREDPLIIKDVVPHYKSFCMYPLSKRDMMF